MRWILALSIALWLPLSVAAQEGDDDVGYLAGLLQDALSGAGREVQIRGFRGALSSEASIDSLSISDDEGEWFRAENIVLAWTRSALLLGRVDVDAFSAESIVISRAPLSEEAPPSAEATPFQIPDLPVSIEIEQINAQSVVLGEPLIGENVELSVTGAAALDGQAVDVQFALDRIDGETARISLTANYDPDARDLIVDLAAEEEAGGIVGRLLDIPGLPQLSLTVQGEGNVEEFDAQLNLSTDGQPRVSGTVAILAPEADDSWDVRVDIDGDPTPLLKPDMQNFFGSEIALRARMIGEASGRIDLPEFDLTARAMTVTGTAALSASGWPETFDVAGVLKNPDGGPVVLPFGGGETRVSEVDFNATYQDDLQFDAIMTAFENPAATLDRLTLQGRGEIDPAQFASDGRLALDLTLNAQSLSMTDPALAEAIGTDLSGAAQIDYASGDPIRVTDLELSGADYGLTGSAIWNAAETIPLDLDLQVLAEDIARFSALAGQELGGRAEVTIDGTVGPISGMADVIVEGTTLDLQVGQDIANRILTGVGTARLDVRRDETGTLIRQARVVTDGARIDAEGKVTTQKTDMRFSGALRDLGLIYPGEADGRADLRGTASLAGVQLVRMDVSADLSNQSAAVALPFAGGMTLSGSSFEVTATGGSNGSWIAELFAGSLQSSVVSSNRLEISGSGALTQSESGGLLKIGGDVATAAEGLRFADQRLSQALGPAPSMSAEFDWEQDKERLTLNGFALQTEALDARGSALVTKTMTSPAAEFALAFVADDFSPLSGLAGQSLRGRGALDVTGSFDTAGPFDVTVDGQAVELGMGNPTLNRLLAGTTDISARVKGADGALDSLNASVSNPEISARVNGPLSGLDLTAELRDLGLIAPDFAGPLRIDGRVGRSGERVSVDIDLDGPGGTTLRVDGQVIGSSNANLTINGDAPLGLANTFIEPRRVNGRAQLDLALRGPLALTSLSGTITPSSTEFSAPTLGVILAPITGQLEFQNGALLVGLSAQGNYGGTLDVNGRLGLNELNANITTAISRFGIQDPALYDTSLDGTVSITGPIGRDLLIAGEIRLNETEIQVPSSGAFALGDIPNIEHLGATRPVMRTIERAGLTNEPETQSATGRSTTRLDLTLNAPNQVFVRGRGLDAELGGDLRLTGPTSGIVAEGGFELVRGRLDVLNQRFELDEGRIQLSGSFIPVLRFVATTEANGIVVRVILDGPASSPDISFSSEPELPEDEVLAQLLFGRDLSNLTALQALELANAVATLAGGGAGGILSNLRDGFGLDDLDVTQTEDGDAAVRAGAYLSENVYTDVVVEGGGRTEINLNLDITSDFTARGSVDNDGNSSIGIFFERDY